MGFHSTINKQTAFILLPKQYALRDKSNKVYGCVQLKSQLKVRQASVLLRREGGEIPVHYIV